MDQAQETSTPHKRTSIELTLPRYDGTYKRPDEVESTSRFEDEGSPDHETAPSRSTSPIAATDASVYVPGSSGLQWAMAHELGVKDEKEPSSIYDLRKDGWLIPADYPKYARKVAMCTHLMTKHKRGIQQDETQLIFSILNAFNSATPLPTDIAQGSRLQDVLKNIQGETSRYRGPFAYPEPLQRNATILLDRLAIETGAEESDTAATTSPPEPKPSPSSTRETAKPGWAGGSTTKSTSGSNDLTDAMRNHPIIKHVMRGLMYGREQSRVPKQDPNDTKHKKECYIEGHNGLEMGQWWPYRACALRDGAHGASQGGIAGNGTDGAFSIVVSNVYDDLDLDQGYTLHYSGSNSLNNTDPENAQISYMTAALQRSHTIGRQIRVIRSCSSNSRWAPRAGLRYDGLYMIVGEETMLNKKKGAYLRFKMERVEGQGVLEDLKVRPNDEEEWVWEVLRG